MGQPNATSTPNTKRFPEKRKSIHSENCYQKMQSPSIIEQVSGDKTTKKKTLTKRLLLEPSPKRTSVDVVDDNDDEVEKEPSVGQESDDSKSDEEYESGDEKIESTPEPEQHISVKESNLNKLGYFVAFIVLIICSVYTVYTKYQLPVRVNYKDLVNKFPSQERDFWISIKSGVADVNKFKRPSTFILLYGKDTETTFDKLLTNIGQYASWEVRDCHKQPIVIEGKELNLFSEDYGQIILKYKDELKDVGVMIVKNLEDVSGQSAQAFHSYCDEVMPLVDKAVIVFTVNIEEFSENVNNYMERYLRNLWVDLPDEIFYPLFTRMSSMILRVQPEQDI